MARINFKGTHERYTFYTRLTAAAMAVLVFGLEFFFISRSITHPEYGDGGWAVVAWVFGICIFVALMVLGGMTLNYFHKQAKLYRRW